MNPEAVRGPLLVPEADGTVTFYADGMLVADEHGRLTHVGPPIDVPHRSSNGVMLPPLLDIHIHIPQHPIRGDFVKGVPADAPEGQLLAGLKKNVFPAEINCNDRAVTEAVTREFLADTLAHGVVGGAAYMTSSAAATEVALEILPETWSVGLVLMNQNCPEDLRTDEANLDADVERIAKRFGRRLIITDRFAVATSSDLRRRGAALAERFGLRTQTHLNEQVAEKQFVERELYPDADSYTDVYRRDGLLEHDCIVAHCIEMTEPEWGILTDTGSTIAHCPTSNLKLGSNVMPLDEVKRRGLPYAIATDVGASPTVSMLAEMKRFLTVHDSPHANHAEALFRATRAPADLLGLVDGVGRLEVGRPMSFIEVAGSGADTDSVISSLLPADMDDPASTVNRVTINGETKFDRDA
ncbi:MAG: amidohydrolase family protein [Planctomycetota bacterium]